MKKICLFIITNLFILYSGMSQTGICAGKVVEKTTDAENKPFEKNIVSATVFLYRNDSLILSMMTNDEGVYEFSKLAQGKYSLKIESTGYLKKEIKDVMVWNGKVTLVRRTYLGPYSEGNDQKGVIFKKK